MVTSKHSFDRLSGAKARRSYALLNPPSFALRATEGRPVVGLPFPEAPLRFAFSFRSGRWPAAPPVSAPGETFPARHPLAKPPSRHGNGVRLHCRGPRCRARTRPHRQRRNDCFRPAPGPVQHSILNLQPSPAQGGLNGSRGSAASRTIGCPQPGQRITRAGRGGGGGGAFQSSSANTRAHLPLAAGLHEPK